MSSLAKKGEKGKMNNSTPATKDTSVHPSTKNTSKSVDLKNSESTKSGDQLNPKLQPTAEQLRIAQMISDSKRDDPDLPDKVNKLVELTNCSADAAIIALHDANNDLDHAIAALLDGETEGDWEVSGKKKKPKQSAQQPSASAGEAETGNGGAVSGSGRGREWNRDRERSRSNRGGPPRLRGRGRGRDNKENVDDAEADSFGGSRGRGSRGGPRMSNGPGREGSGGMRGGGRMGRGAGTGGGGFRRPRPAPADTWGGPMDEAHDFGAMTNVDSWGGGSDFPSTEEWDNEEYIGSLVETKVFTPSQAATSVTPVPAALPEAAAPLMTNGSSLGAVEPAAVVAAPLPPQQQQMHYSVVSNSTQQGIDLNALLQKTSVSGNPSVQQPYLQYSQATDALKAAMGVPSSASTSVKSTKQMRAKIPPPSKIPLSAVEMPDEPLVAGLDVKFGTLDFGIESTGFEMNLDAPLSTAVSSHSVANKQTNDQQQQHVMMSKMDQYGNSSSVAQPPAPSALPKPDSSLGGFSSSVPSAAASMATTASQVKSTSSQQPASYPYGTSYAPPGVNSSASQSSSSGSTQPAGAYPSNTQTSGVYNNSNAGAASTSYQSNNSQSNYGTYAAQQQQQQQQQQPSTYQSYNNKLNATSSLTADSSNSVASLRSDLAGAPASSRQPVAAAASTANKLSGTALANASGSGLPNLPPGVPTMLGPGGFMIGQAPGLPYYPAGIQQHPVYSLEDMQYRYPHLATAQYYDVGYQSPTSLGTGREGTLASMAYTGSDAKFSRNENNSPVPTSLSQTAAQSHGGAFITPAAAAAATPLTPAYAYYYNAGVMSGGYHQFSAPAALYPVSAAASGHAGSGAAVQYGKGGPLGASGAATAQAGQTSGSGTGGGPSAGTASYSTYGSSYDDFPKSVYGSVGVGSAAGPAAKIGGVGAPVGPTGVGAAGSTDLGVGPNAYGKTHSQLSKINTYDKSGGFHHTGTPPPYGNATGAPIGVGVSVGVGGPQYPQHMFIPTLAPHQSQHSHLMHQQLHQDSASGPGQRSQSGGQQNKSGSKPAYGGGSSYWGSN